MILEHVDLLPIQEASVSARLAEERQTLLVGIPATVRAMLPDAGSPGAQLLRDLDTLNQAGTLTDGTIPLATWLRNARTLTSLRPESTVFEAALRRVNNSRSARSSAHLGPSSGKEPQPLDQRPSEPAFTASLAPSSHSRGQSLEAPLRALLTPRYLDPTVKSLSEDLRAAYDQRKERQALGESTANVDQVILELRRRIREGGQLRAGDLLALDRYLLLEQIGRGGFASVWRAVDRQRHLVVAIKVMHPNLAGDPIRFERFYRGARAMAELNHELVVRVLEPVSEDGGFHFFVMEFVEGVNLHRGVLEGKVSHQDAIPLILKVGRALALANSQGMVHRDVKPANILLNLDGEPKLTDFDLVGAANTTGGTRTGALGTFVYAAPECLTHPQDADGRADVYGLGMTAVFCLFGRDLPATVLRDPGLVLESTPCSRAVRGVLRRAIAWDREQRFATATEFCDALDAARNRRSVVDVLLLSRRWSRGRPWMYAPIAGLLAVILVVAFAGGARAPVEPKTELELDSGAPGVTTVPPSAVPTSSVSAQTNTPPGPTVVKPAVSPIQGGLPRPTSGPTASIQDPPAATGTPMQLVPQQPTATTVTQGTAAKLRPDRGYLRVNSAETGTVYVNGAPRGTPGGQIEVECGKALRVGVGIPDPTNPKAVSWSSPPQSKLVGCGSSVTINM